MAYAPLPNMRLTPRRRRSPNCVSVGDELDYWLSSVPDGIGEGTLVVVVVEPYLICSPAPPHAPGDVWVEHGIEICRDAIVATR